MTTPSDIEARAREIVDNGPGIIGTQNERYYVSAIAKALEEERERCAKLVSAMEKSQRNLAKGNYSHEHHAAYMLKHAAAAICNQKDSGVMPSSESAEQFVSAEGPLQSNDGETL